MEKNKKNKSYMSGYENRTTGYDVVQRKTLIVLNIIFQPEATLE